MYSPISCVNQTGKKNQKQSPYIIDFQHHLLDNIAEEIIDILQTSSDFAGLDTDEMKLMLNDSTCKDILTLYNNAAYRVELKMKDLFVCAGSSVKNVKAKFAVEGTYNNDIKVSVEAKNIYAKILTA